MKKNIFTIIIMALCFMNFILTAVVVFAIVPAANKTTNLVNKVAEVVNLEVGIDEEKEQKVNPAKVQSYKIEGDLTLNLIRGKDGSDHYGRIDAIVLSLNEENDDYKKLSKTIEANESFVTDIVHDVIAEYTYEEAVTNTVEMRKEILKRIQKHFDSDFIYSISLTNLRFQ